MRTKFWSTLAAVFAMLMLPIAQAHAAPVHAPRMLTQAQMQSSHFKTVVLDVKTGKILESWFSDPPVSTQISTHTICNTADACYVAGRALYANQGFYGSPGTAYGNWLYRSSLASGDHTISACWRSSTGTTCMNHRLPPHAQAGFNGSLVTGTSLTIY